MVTDAPLPRVHRVHIGVTGHRKLRDQSADARTITKTLDDLIGASARRGDAPIAYTAVSPLAEGADRLVARVVLTYPGAGLQAVLPLTIDDYLEDFETSESRHEFRTLLAKSAEPVFLRSRSIATDAGSAREAAELRRAAYENVGRYVVDHCDLLLALWDGQPGRGRGGTKEIIDYAIAQGRAVLRIWDGKCTILGRGAGFELSSPIDPND